MSEAFGSTSDPSSQASSATSNRAVGSVLRAIAYLSVAGALTMVGFGAYRMVQDRAVMFETRDHLNEQRGLIQPVKKHLDAEYIDTDGNLLADLPGDQGKLINPDTLVLAHYIDAEVEKQLVDWDALKASLEQATGKTVVLQEYVNTADDVAAVKAGEIQLVALHAADAPYVVNNAGLIPLGVLGTSRAWKPTRHRRSGWQQNQCVGRHSRPQADLHGAEFDDRLSRRDHRAARTGGPTAGR